MSRVTLLSVAQCGGKCLACETFRSLPLCRRRPAERGSAVPNLAPLLVLGSAIAFTASLMCLLCLFGRPRRHGGR